MSTLIGFKQASINYLVRTILINNNAKCNGDYSIVLKIFDLRSKKLWQEKKIFFES